MGNTGGALKILTLEKLEHSETLTAQLWRLIREQPGLTEIEIRRRLGVGTRGSNEKLRRLISRGWALRLGSGTKKDQYRYTGIVNEEKPGQHLGERLKELRKSLTRISKKAHDARYTGLAAKMSAALMEIEKETTEVRDQLYVRR